MSMKIKIPKQAAFKQYGFELEVKNVDNKQLVCIKDLLDDSIAKEAGLRDGHCIIEFNGMGIAGFPLHVVTLLLERSKSDLDLLVSSEHCVDEKATSNDPSEAEVKDASKVDIKVDINAEAEVDVKPADNNAELELNDKAEMNAKSDIDIKSADKNAVSEMDVKPDINAVSDVDVKSQIDTVSEVDINSDINAVVNVDVNSDINAVVDVEVNSDINALSEVDIKTEIKTESEVEINFDIDAPSEEGNKTNIKTASAVDLHSDMNAKSKVDIMTHMKAESEVDVKASESNTLSMPSSNIVTENNKDTNQEIMSVNSEITSNKSSHSIVDDNGIITFHKGMYCPVAGCQLHDSNDKLIKFNSIDNYRPHWDKYHTKFNHIFKCTFCDQKVFTKNNAISHAKNRHSLTGTYPVTIILMDYFKRSVTVKENYIDPGLLMLPSGGGAIPHYFQCLICQWRTPDFDSYSKHCEDDKHLSLKRKFESIHSDGFELYCYICQKRLTSNSEFNDHVSPASLSHQRAKAEMEFYYKLYGTQKGQYWCSKCSHGTITVKDLKTHLESDSHKNDTVPDGRVNGKRCISHVDRRNEIPQKSNKRSEQSADRSYETNGNKNGNKSRESSEKKESLESENGENKDERRQLKDAAERCLMCWELDHKASKCPQKNWTDKRCNLCYGKKHSYKHCSRVFLSNLNDEHFCSLCTFECKTKIDFYKHLGDDLHRKKLNQKDTQNRLNFSEGEKRIWTCELCNFRPSNLGDWEDHQFDVNHTAKLVIDITNLVKKVVPFHRHSSCKVNCTICDVELTFKEIPIHFATKIHRFQIFYKKYEAPLPLAKMIKYTDGSSEITCKVSRKEFDGTRLIVVYAGSKGYGFLFSYDVLSKKYIIGHIEKNSPADACGLKKHDIIVSVNGNTIDHLKHETVLKLVEENPKMTSLRIQRSQDDKNIVPSPYKRPNEGPIQSSPAYKLVKNNSETTPIHKEEPLLEADDDDEDEISEWV